MTRMTKKLRSLIANRLFILALFMAALFAVLFTRLYDIQIVSGQEILVGPRVQTTSREIVAPRGEIFDRNGQPLAINEATVTIKLDPNVQGASDNEMLIAFVRLMDAMGETLVDDLPISATEPKVFLFGGSERRLNQWKRDMGLNEGITAQQAYDNLMVRFQIPAAELTEHEARMVLSMRRSLHYQRFRRNPITIAHSVGTATQAAIEERNQDFPGFFIDIDYLRVYPEGRYVSHIIGYIRRINSDQLLQWADYGYTADSIVGQLGLERSFERYLRGHNGRILMETDETGRRLGILESESAAAGNNVFLTLDIGLQRELYHIIERQLTDIIIAKLRANPWVAGARAQDTLSARQLLASMVSANTVAVAPILNAESGTLSRPIRDFVEANFEGDPGGERAFIAASVGNGITENRLLLAMYEQGIVHPTEAEFYRMLRGDLPSTPFIIRMLEEGYITPDMTNVRPNSASAVMIDVNTGAVLASVSYPSFDNNRFVNTFDNAYWNHVNTNPNSPMLNRAFVERRPPGSTFKMITATAAMENGFIGSGGRIACRFTFNRVGRPYAHCHSRHGTSNNVEEAIAISCNYFFYELQFRMGNARDGTSLEGIGLLNQYMIYFGLGQPTGVEIFDIFASINAQGMGALPISSPEYRARRQGSRWTDGDSIRTAIGQADNSLTAASMAKFTATLANGGYRYQMHFLSHIETVNQAPVRRFEPVLEAVAPMSTSTVNTIHRGMLLTTTGSRGTARSMFAGFPVQVAGKTGTAQEAGWPNHTAFSAFAPFDDPSVAIYVMMPGSAQSSISAPAARVARDALAVYFHLDTVPQRPDRVGEFVMR